LKSGKAFNKAVVFLRPYQEDYMPKVTVDIPQHIIDDVNAHVGDGRKFVSFSDAMRTALRKMLDQLDEIDRRRGRAQE
jgi:Arc/MetJ-type ribon-helix-helix transcriptional regulator